MCLRRKEKRSNARARLERRSIKERLDVHFLHIGREKEKETECELNYKIIRLYLYRVLIGIDQRIR